MPAPLLARLENPVRTYAWGSREILARLQGREVPTTEPEAELWLGAHPLAPSTWLLEDGPRPLDAAIAERPEHLLGSAAVRRYGPRLPFLLKLLAVAHPLSLQAHPTTQRAQEGFAREDALGVPVDAPNRNYTDPWSKPELIRAITPFDAFCGFREVGATLQLLSHLDVARLDELTVDLRRDGAAGLAPVIGRLLRLPEPDRAPLVGALGQAAARLADRGGRWGAEGRWLAELADRYPADPGVAVASLLELVRLEPGESLHVPPGTLHSYLSGCAVEIMASSDNVLRGGLTAKYVDVPELLSVVEPVPGRARRLDPRRDGHERVHPSPSPVFRLSELELTGDEVRLDERGGQLLLVLDGDVEVAADHERSRLATGDGAFVAAAATTVRVRGHATLFRATIGDG